MTRKSLFCAIIIALALSACGSPAATPAPTQSEPRSEVSTPLPYPTFTKWSQYMLPPYYASYYGNTIEASKNEPTLIVYSTMSAQNWTPVLDGFGSHYPWINVETYQLDSTEVFDRYLSETNTPQAKADILISANIAMFKETLDKGEVLPYRTQEDSYIPEWSKLHDGLIAVSVDPTIIIYNKTAVSTPPETMEQLAQWINKDAGAYQRQITSYDAELSAIGFTVNWFWAKNKGEAGWETLSVIGSTSPSLLTSDTRMIDAVLSGKSKIGYFVSTTSVFPKLKDSPNLGWAYIKDGQPIQITGIGITQRGSSQNSAKLLMDYLLSQEGQIALSYGGLIPHRSDVYGISEHHLQSVLAIVGEQNAILMLGDPEISQQLPREEFLLRWKTALGKQ
jgi:iron(III) transport system substrate-binding protein